jgi:hypothetical protein
VPGVRYNDWKEHEIVDGPELISKMPLKEVIAVFIVFESVVSIAGN